MKVQAFAGTGKSLIVSLVIEALVKETGTKKGVVVLVTPSRNLRDSILQAPDLLGFLRDGDDTGPRVMWLGQQAETANPLPSWGDKVAKQVE